MEGTEVVTDTRKRNTILTLVAWLKRILQTPTTDSNASCTEAQLFALTDLLPTELLLTKLMPQLGNSDEKQTAVDENSKGDDRSPASSKRFSRQRNNRFNTIGVSKEELADARLYLQKKLLSENLATTATKISTDVDQQHNILDESDDSRRKSLNLSQKVNLDETIENILKSTKNSFSKSIDIVPSDEDINLNNITPSTTISSYEKVINTREKEQSEQNHSKVVLRKKSNPNSQTNHRQFGNLNQNPTTDTDDDDEQPNNSSRKISSGTTGTSSKSMNKFALRKMKMKRANTIDIPKNDFDDDLQTNHIYTDNNKNLHRTETTINNIRQQIKTSRSIDVDKDHLPEFQIKSPHDKKFHAFLNRNNEENRLSWINPNKNASAGSPNSHQNTRTNWNSKFGSIKNSFEQIDGHISQGLSKKNSFTHAPTSPFKLVQNNKPPQIPNGSYPIHNNNQQVLRKIATIQNNEHKEQVLRQSNPKPQLKSHQSFPSYIENRNNSYNNLSSSQMRSNEWQQNKYSSVDNNIHRNNSPKMISSAYNPLYVPPNKPTFQPSAPYVPSVPTVPLVPSVPSVPPVPSPIKTPISPVVGEFPSYTFTSTDYTQPTSVSTFGPENGAPQIKNTILPDTSYLRNQTPKTVPPSLGSAALNMQMKTIDIHSSSEYLSEPTSYFRSPQPFSPSYDNNYPNSYDSQPESQEFTAKSQVMRYPQTQTATVINKTKRYEQDDNQQPRYIHSYLRNNVRGDRKYSEPYSEKNASISPSSETSFCQVNQTYVPPQEPLQSRRSKPVNNFISMENISTKFDPSEQAAPIRLRNNTSYYGSHAALTPSRNMKYPIDDLSQKTQKTVDDMKQKVAAPAKLNSCGGQYIQPKVDCSFDKTGPTFGKILNSIQSNVTNVNRSQTITHPRTSNMEFKRKQSLPAQATDYFDSVYSPKEENLPPTHNYLPSGVLKRSKSTHTLALLQQFENKGKSSDIPEKAPLPAYIKKPLFNAPVSEIKSNPSKPNQLELESNTKSIISIGDDKPKTVPIQPIIKSNSNALDSLQRKHSATQQSKSQQNNILKTSAVVTDKIKGNHLDAPSMDETPASPSVEDGHIIYPGQTNETRNRVQHYAQTLNAILNRKSIVLDDDEDDDSDKNDFSVGKIGVLQKSKSGTLLSVPKQYESAIRKSEVEEKQRTVAAYFSANKSPSQSLQRSSSQHSVLSSSSFKSVKESSNAASPLNTDEMKRTVETTDSTVSKSLTTTTKSSHHLKILRRQQKSTSNSPLTKSQTLPSINLLDESNVDDAFEDLFASFNAGSKK